MTLRITGPLLAGLVLLAALPASAAQQRSGRRAPDREAATVERLNEESLQRARQNMNSPTPEPDTTQNLNRLSGEAARQGRNQTGAPMPFR